MVTSINRQFPNWAGSGAWIAKGIYKGEYRREYNGIRCKGIPKGSPSEISRKPFLIFLLQKYQVIGLAHKKRAPFFGFLRKGAPETRFLAPAIPAERHFS